MRNRFVPILSVSLDTSVRAGNFSSYSHVTLDVAHELQDATPEEITFAILPGWRDEIANRDVWFRHYDHLEAAKVPPQEFDFGWRQFCQFCTPMPPHTTSSAAK
jgi:hypothetical protein